MGQRLIRMAAFLRQRLESDFVLCWLAYGLFMWVQRFLASYFAYRLCRDSLRLNHLACVFAGMAFSLCQWNVYDSGVAYWRGGKYEA